MIRSEDGQRTISWGAMTALGVLGLILLLGLVGACMIGEPNYRVWEQKLAGEAELNRATYNRRIAVQEAIAKKESAKSLADADTIRAEGAARANVILGKSLQGNEDYLRYLWIQGLEAGKNSPEVIYVPTEAGLPILEAGHRRPPATPQTERP